MIDTHHHTFAQPIECTIQRVNPEVNHGLCVIMCRRGFINCNKCTTLVSDVDNSEGYACAGAKSIWGISVSSSQSSREPKTALKFVLKK